MIGKVVIALSFFYLLSLIVSMNSRLMGRVSMVSVMGSVVMIVMALVVAKFMSSLDLNSLNFTSWVMILPLGMVLDSISRGLKTLSSVLTSATNTLKKSESLTVTSTFGHEGFGLLKVMMLVPMVFYWSSFANGVLIHTQQAGQREGFYTDLVKKIKKLKSRKGKFTAEKGMIVVFSLGFPYATSLRSMSQYTIQVVKLLPGSYLLRVLDAQNVPTLTSSSFLQLPSVDMLMVNYENEKKAIAQKAEQAKAEKELKAKKAKRAAKAVRAEKELSILQRALPSTTKNMKKLRSMSAKQRLVDNLRHRRNRRDEPLTVSQAQQAISELTAVSELSKSKVAAKKNKTPSTSVTKLAKSTKSKLTKPVLRDLDINKPVNVAKAEPENDVKTTEGNKE